jgi:uncharacterized protein involved in exopolysaccharide biosynthesis
MEERRQKPAAADDAVQRETVVHRFARVQDQRLVPVASISRSMRRHWFRITLVVCLALALAAAYLLVTPTRYTASALILIDTKNSGALREVPITADMMTISANIESQVEILRSQRMLRQVVQSEALVGNPALDLGLLRGTYARLVRAIMGQPDPVLSSDEQVLAAMRALQGLTSVKRLGITYLVEVQVTLDNPATAARVANGYARTYIEDQRKLNVEFARRTGELLSARTQELREQARAAEEAVEQFKFSGPVRGQDATSARVTLKDLESSAQTLRVMHDKFLERSAQALQQQHFVIPDAELISPAFPPLNKSWPRPPLVLAAALFIGLLIGTLWALLLDRNRKHP